MSYFFIATDEKFCKIQIFIGCFAYLYPFLKKKHITILILCFSMQFLLEWNKASWGENTALHVQLRIISTCFFYIFEERDDVHREPVQTTQEANMRLQWESSGTPFFFFAPWEFSTFSQSLAHRFGWTISPEIVWRHQTLNFNSGWILDWNWGLESPSCNLWMASLGKLWGTVYF